MASKLQVSVRCPIADIGDAERTEEERKQDEERGERQRLQGASVPRQYFCRLREDPGENGFLDFPQLMAKYGSITLRACDARGDPVEFKAIKDCLIDGSRYFASLFESDDSETVFDFDDITADLLRDILRYLHHGTILISPSTCYNYLLVADYFGMDQLTESCLQFFNTHISPRSLCDMYHAFQIRNFSGRIPDLLNYVKSHTDSIINKRNAPFVDYEFITKVLFPKDATVTVPNETALAAFLVEWIHLQYEAQKRAKGNLKTLREQAEHLLSEVIWVTLPVSYRDSLLLKPFIQDLLTPALRNQIDKAADFAPSNAFSRIYTGCYRAESAPLAGLLSNVKLSDVSTLKVLLPMERAAFAELVSILYLMPKLARIQFTGGALLGGFTRQRSADGSGDSPQVFAPEELPSQIALLMKALLSEEMPSLDQLDFKDVQMRSEPDFAELAAVKKKYPTLRIEAPLVPFSPMPSSARGSRSSSA